MLQNTFTGDWLRDPAVFAEVRADFERHYNREFLPLFDAVCDHFRTSPQGWLTIPQLEALAEGLRLPVEVATTVVYGMLTCQRHPFARRAYYRQTAEEQWEEVPESDVTGQARRWALHEISDAAWSTWAGAVIAVLEPVTYGND